MSKKKAKQSVGQEMIESLREFVVDVRQDKAAAERKFHHRRVTLPWYDEGMLTPRFTNCCEIRMGSPFNRCDLTLEGPWVPEFPECDWQDLWAHDPSGRLVALVAWDFISGEPGFRVFTIDTKTKRAARSDRFSGCCRSIEWDDVGFRLDIHGFVHPPRHAVC